MSAKRGRPTSNPKKEYIIVRATQQDKELLKECCQQLAQTQYEVVMDGISAFKYSKTRKTNGGGRWNITLYLI